MYIRSGYWWCSSLVKTANFYFKYSCNCYSNHDCSYLSADWRRKFCNFCFRNNSGSIFALFTARCFSIISIFTSYDYIAVKIKYFSNNKRQFLCHIIFFTFKSWFCLDTLQPVNYTEGILTMLNDLSVLLYIIGIIVLFWIPVYFLISSINKNRNICIGITLYYWLMILSTFMGNFPVPFMGYGISPILGYYIFLIWFIHEAKKYRSTH